MAKKPVKRPEYKEIIYDARHWALLRQSRQKAMKIMETLENSRLQSITHGSTARGDVNPKSDIDIFIPYQTPSFTVETTLEQAGTPINRRLIVQATPAYAMKAYIEIDENTTVSFPLMKMRKVEREFYKFSGELTLTKLKEDMRIVGVDKRLMLIEPTEKGHGESTIMGREEQVAKLLGTSTQTVLDRVRTLLRRDEVGRTGVFIKKELSADETFEMILGRLATQNPAVRRRLTSLF